MNASTPMRARVGGRVRVRTGPRRSSELPALGVSTRGGIAWIRAARARAWMERRPQLTIDDLHELAVPALAHRLIAVTSSDDGVAVAAERVREIVATTAVPR